jgi:hypothetical protein
MAHGWAMVTKTARLAARAAAAASATEVERETRLVREAIAMVAMGGSPRVVVAGIQHGPVLLDAARRLALEAGVRVNPIWRDNERLADVAVERIRE